MEDTSRTIRERRSIRKYLPDKVPDAVLRELLEEALWAPSWENTQSTYCYLLSGEPMERFRSSFLRTTAAKTPPAPDLELPRSWPESSRSRAVSLTKTVEASVDEPLMESAARLFGAPHLIVIAASKEVCAHYACFDAGLCVQTIALAAEARGLGTCIMAYAICYPELLRAVIPDANDKDLIVGVTIGYPDRDAAINQFPRERAPFAERVTFIGA